MIKKYIALCSLIASFFIIVNCNNNSSSTNHVGKKLVKKYCTNCHLPVPPEMLDSITWTDHVLPAMAPKLGIQVWSGKFYFDDSKVASEISFSDWNKLVDYYKRLAPQKLIPATPPVSLKKDWSVFRLKIPQWRDTLQIATTSLVKIDPLHHAIYSADATTNKIYNWNEKLQATKLNKLSSPPVNLYLGKGQEGIISCIGTLTARNWRNGKIVAIDLTDKKDTGNILIEGLPRPVATVAGDFNKDEKQDWVVCAFGHDIGGLYLFQQTVDEKFEKKQVSAMPGAEKAVVRDFNHDGWPDIMALFAQAREGLWLFLNNHNGGFTTKKVLEFPPEYGSTSFQLVDFNQDGRPDILYTCGDNGDYSQILKPFHGVYIFFNKGNFKYEQAYFYPINGCTKAIAADFDKDGDLDISTIAFFADRKNNPSESFIYFEQVNLLHFIPHAVPINQYGRWICMDAGDYDGDGDLDIVLGNYSNGFTIQDSLTVSWNKHLPLIVLANNSNTTFYK